MIRVAIPGGGKSFLALVVVLAIAFELVFTACADSSTCLRESDCANGYSCIVGACAFVQPAPDDGGADADANANPVADASIPVDAASSDASDVDASDDDANADDGSIDSVGETSTSDASAD